MAAYERRLPKLRTSATPRERQLLDMLTEAGEAGLCRTVLAAAVCPTATQPYSALSAMVSRLRPALPAGCALLGRKGVYVLHLPPSPPAEAPV